MKNGIEITFTAQLFRELAEQYPVKKLVKFTANAFLKAIEKDIDQEYKRVYDLSPETTINLSQKIGELAETVGKMDMAEIVLFNDFAKRFYDNRHIAKEKGQSFFNKILI
jgi:hemerythrin-like domain-containing protein